MNGVGIMHANGRFEVLSYTDSCGRLHIKAKAANYYDLENPRYTFIKVKPTIEYNWAPWVTVQTDHEHFMQITPIDHDDNVYPVKTKRLKWDLATFNHWQYIFTGKLEPVQLPTTQEIYQA